MGGRWTIRRARPRAQHPALTCPSLALSGSPENALEALLLLGPPRHRRCSALSPRKRTTSQSKTEPPLLRTSKRTIYTAGRPPWYNEAGTPFKEAFVIGEPVRARSLAALCRRVGRWSCRLFSSFGRLVRRQRIRQDDGGQQDY